MNMITGIKDQINSIYAKLKNSPLEEVELYPPITNDRIIKFEEMFCVKLPLDYRSLLLLSNGFYYESKYPNYINNPISDDIIESTKTLICIDHHASNDSFGDLNYINPKESSTL